MAQLTTKYQRSIMRYLYADGLLEITLGLFFLGMFASRWLDDIAGQALPIVSALPLLNALVFIGLMPVVERLRERITYPRLGYARYKPSQQNQRVVIAVIILALAALTLHYIRGAAGSAMDFSAMLSIGSTAIMGLCWARAGYASGLARFYVLSGVTFALPIGLALLKQPDTLLGFPVIVLGQGVLLVGFGLWALLRLLRMPITATANDDES